MSDKQTPCYCAETSTRNCPTHQNGGDKQTPKTFEEFIETDDCPIDIDLWRTRSGFILKDEMQKLVNFIGKYFWNAAVEATRAEYDDKIKAMQAEIDRMTIIAKSTLAVLTQKELSQRGEDENEN